MFYCMNYYKRCNIGFFQLRIKRNWQLFYESPDLPSLSLSHERLEPSVGALVCSCKDCKGNNSKKKSD